MLIIIIYIHKNYKNIILETRKYYSHTVLTTQTNGIVPS